MFNRKLCGALGAAAIATTGVLLSAGSIFADPPEMLINPPFHRHFVVLPDGTMIPVGPNLCEHPELQQAFNEFHYNIHHSELPGVGHIATLGPQNGAPGLHNGQGAEIIGVRGCE
ncbi:MAG TPA: hypothetical protein VF065_11380 [Ilumatobacter sp.]